MNLPFQLYRFYHGNGRAKDWAWRRDPEGTLTVRWGPAGRLLQHKTYPAEAADRLKRTLNEKQRKGYRWVGEHRLDHQGQLLDPRGVWPNPAIPDRPSPATAPVTPPVAARPAIDLSRIDSAIADDWF